MSDAIGVITSHGGCTTPANATASSAVGGSASSKSGVELQQRARGPRRTNGRRDGDKRESQDGAVNAATPVREASRHKKTALGKQQPHRNQKGAGSGSRDGTQKPPAPPPQTSQSVAAVAPPPAPPVGIVALDAPAAITKQRAPRPKRNSKPRVKRSDADGVDKQPATHASPPLQLESAAAPSAPVSDAVAPRPLAAPVGAATDATIKRREPKAKRIAIPREPSTAAVVTATVKAAVAPNDRRERKPSDASETLLAHAAGVSVPLPDGSVVTAVAASTSTRNDKPVRQSSNSSDKRAAADAMSSTPLLPDLATPARFEDAPWFIASSGDLRFAQWLFGRSQGTADVSALQDAAMLTRAYALYTLEKKVQHELQRRPTSQQIDSVDDSVDDNVDDAAVDDDAVATSDTALLWPPTAIVDDVARVLRVSRLALWTRMQTQLTAGESNAGQKKRSLERTLVKEVVENTTELLLSRAGFDDIAVLERWMTFVGQSDNELAQEAATANTRDDALADAGVGADIANSADSSASLAAAPSKRERKRQERQRASGTDSATGACEMVRVGIAFLRDCHAVASANVNTIEQHEHAPTTWPAVREQALTSELTSVYLRQRLTEVDELRRQRLASDLQQFFRRRYDGQWRKCEVVLFGSSLSLFGATGSDLDMCLLLRPQEASAAASTTSAGRVVGGRELRALISGKASAQNSSSDDHALDMVALQELRFQAIKSIEKITVLYNSIGLPADATRSQRKQQQQLMFFRAHYKLLLSAIDSRVAAFSRTSDASSANESADAVAQAAALRVKQLVAKSRRQSDEMFRVRAALERMQCRVKSVISGARIPIIRFTHAPTTFECDLCFENVLATRNTFLLRAYARVDERARVLGMAVKHWAKQRGVNDASMGFLSSYSYVLLAIYFLQTVARVLPNLQDPALLAAAHVAPEHHADVNIAFCTDVAAAQQFHKQQLAASASSSTATTNHSVATLLVWFFEYYATTFDFARRVIAVRSPDATHDKHDVWGRAQARSWRMSIQDPLETTRDLGCVLQFKCQAQILCELKRAYALLRDGTSFSDVAAPAASVAAAAAAPTTTGRQQRGAAGKARGGAKAAGANKENIRSATDALAKPSGSSTSKSRTDDKTAASTDRAKPRVRKTERGASAAVATRTAVPIAAGADSTA